MSPAALLLFAATAMTLPPAQPPPQRTPPTREVERTPIRCRPAPYYIADTGARPRIERITVTGSRIPLREVDKRQRPCLLMRTLDTPTQYVPRIADN